MKKFILMLATIGTFAFANAQQKATDSKVAPAATTPAPAAAAQTPAPDPNAPEIKWETKNIDFGKVVKGDESNSTRYFKFTNTGKTPLIISSCHGSCGCTVPSCPTEAILPGKAGEIKVHYDINRPGNFTKTVTVSSNAKNNNETLQITGVVEEKPAATTPAPAAQPAAPVKK
jgi:NAD-dependent dihydropyrimidine dehydrogenase PreA subunit